MNFRSVHGFGVVSGRAASSAKGWSVTRATSWLPWHGLAFMATGLVLLVGCATPAELGRVERLPEGTLPPSKEVGPPVNIQPAPPREIYRSSLRGDPWGPGYRGWHDRYGPGCFDPFICGWGAPSAWFYRGFPGGGSSSGFGLQFRLF